MISAWKLRCADGGFDLHPDDDSDFRNRLLRLIANDGQEESEEFCAIVNIILAAPRLTAVLQRLAAPDVYSTLPDELQSELLNAMLRVNPGFKPFLAGGAREPQ